ncbi:glycerophosphoryl diester phosphodiesterase membrane domain-containing protein [Mycobacterium sp. 155]|uniref:glycerophosphoryl diester phosphodiesterase membrane domain-containing protein n=1 Tax=Mycobacterium sp. 155 TaxID=1157943 RepID=UPI0003A0F3F6|nr:glycerophosphoryl diester phosphodiesterase membrane domain-containing protein [Mycobacterium sp. 155]
MTNDADGYSPYPPPPGPPGYGPPLGYSPPPGYGLPYGYGPPPGYGPPGYSPPPGYPPYGPPPGYPMAFKPGVIPLRPLSLSDIFNGAVNYIRANPKATLGLTTIVVVVAQIISLLLQIGPLATFSTFDSTLQGDTPSAGALALVSAGSFAGIIVTALAGVLLSGMLTVVVGRAVFGGTITIGQAWQRLRGRFWALIGLTALEALAFGLVGAIIALVIVMVAGVGGGVAAFVVGAPLVLAAIVGLIYAVTVLLFAPPLIVLEHQSVFAAVARSFALVKPDFWRVLGIWLLATIVANLIAVAVSVPFGAVGALLSTGPGGISIPGLIVSAIGGVIGQIITAPFNAGVVVLLYTDRRIRAEAFDLVLQTGAVGPAESTDQLWLIRTR